MKIVKSSAILKSKTRSGSDKFWQNHVYQDGKRFFTGSSHWQVNKQGVKSKVTFAEPYECLPKNVGRANATTSEEQAHLEFESAVKKQNDKGYHEEGAEPIAADPLPMLAHKFRDHSHKVVYPCYVQPKLDGMRMLSKAKRGWSRGNKEILPKVFEHLHRKDNGKTLDGELILPGNRPLQETMSAAKKYRPGVSDSLVYWIYDVVDPTKTFEERFVKVPCIPAQVGYIVTPTILCHNEDEVLARHAEFVAQGFEGTIIRDPNGKYEIGQRSYSLMKLKDFEDEEFEVVDVVEGGGVSKGQAILRLVTAKGLPFDSTPEAGHEVRKKMFKNRKQLIGKWATVKFYGKTKDGIPCFNNTIAIRDEDDFK